MVMSAFCSLARALSHSLGPAMVPHWPFRARRMEWMGRRNGTVALHRSSISYLGVMFQKFRLSAETVSNSSGFGWSASLQMVNFSKVFISLVPGDNPTDALSREECNVQI